jgi:hypothetical protein
LCSRQLGKAINTLTLMTLSPADSADSVGLISCGSGMSLQD